MIRNYLKIALRRLWREKGYAAINVTGLALGMASCLLIGLFVRDELSYDDFHEDADRIVFVGKKLTFGERSHESNSTSYPLAETLEREVPSVNKAVHTFWPSPAAVSRDGKTFTEEENVFYVGANFFEIFNFPIISGDLDGGLAEPNTAVISREMAEKHFPNKNPVGKSLIVRDRGQHTYQIVGVAEKPGESYLDFSAVLSLSTLDYANTHGDQWFASMFLTFARLTEGTTTSDFERQAAQVAQAHIESESNLRVKYFTEPITGLYLSDLVSPQGFRGSWRYIYMFSTIALFILLIASINYSNLATARSMKRSREVGVRKTVGASRGQIAWQFLGESVLLSTGAFVLALVLTAAALPLFNQLVSKNIVFGFESSGTFILLAAGTSVGVGTLAGSYPAFYLSGFQPSSVLRGHRHRGSFSGWLRQGLVVLQFMIAVILIIGTTVIYKQLNYTQQKDLGFSGEQVVTISAPSNGTEALRNEVLRHPGVVAASTTNGIPGKFRITLEHEVNKIAPTTGADTTETIAFHPARVDYQYDETLDLNIIAGRFFSKDERAAGGRGYVINRTAAEQLGWTPKEAVGKPLNLDGKGEVIGVVEDFHIESLHQRIEPIALQMHPSESWSSTRSLAIRLAPDAIQRGLRHIEEQKARFTDEPFEYSFLDDAFAQLYQTERQLGQVFASFAGIAILIACLGLFGLAAYAAEQRTREIGIRKVVGATISNIVTLLTRDFLKLVAIALFLAGPVAYYAMQQWLQDFAYRITIGPGIFLLAGSLALGLAFVTVSYQSVQAALTNPAKSLRSE